MPIDEIRRLHRDQTKIWSLVLPLIMDKGARNSNIAIDAFQILDENNDICLYLISFEIYIIYFHFIPTI